MSMGDLDPRSLNALARKFVAHLEQGGHPPLMVRTRRVQIDRFVGWCEEREVLLAVDVSRGTVQQYQRWLYHYRKRDGRPMSRSSQSSLLSAISVWFRWLTKRGFILLNPSADLELPKVDRTLPRGILNADEVDDVLAAIDITQPLGLRDRAVLETLYSTGIRCSELLGLKLADLDAQRGTLLVREAKGGRQRVVPIGARALLWIEQYLAGARSSFLRGHDDQTLFLSRRGKRMHRNTLIAIAGSRVRATGKGPSRAGCHVFRHSAATLMLEGGADIRYIQQLLGHKHLDSTQIYTRVSIQKLKEVHTKTHPAKIDESESTPSDVSESEARRNPPKKRRTRKPRNGK